MKSPLTGKEMVVTERTVILEIEGKNVSATFTYYMCEDTGEIFEDEKFAKKNYKTLQNAGLRN